MLGLIRPSKGHLRFCEYDAYRGIYCGLCKEIGREYGQVMRLFLSNDMTFLVMSRMQLQESERRHRRCRCMIHPMQKQHCFYDDGELSYGAAMTVLLGYYKLQDTLADKEPFWKKLLARMIYPFAKHAYQKAAAQYPLQDEVCKDALKRQALLEQECESHVDKASEPTAWGMGQLLSFQVKGSQKRVLEHLGFLLGRYVYLCDAAADYEKDEKSGSYNPFRYVKVEDSPSLQEQTTHRQELPNSPMKDAIYMTLGEIEKTFALLEPGVFTSIQENILIYGLRQTADGILILSKERGH